MKRSFAIRMCSDDLAGAAKAAHADTVKKEEHGYGI